MSARGIRRLPSVGPVARQRGRATDQEATMWGSIVIIIGGWCHGWHGWW
jgi:hypothetical protein